MGWWVGSRAGGNGSRHGGKDRNAARFMLKRFLFQQLSESCLFSVPKKYKKRKA